jgi:hypothetical protein
MGLSDYGKVGVEKVKNDDDVILSEGERTIRFMEKLTRAAVEGPGANERRW